MKLRNKKGFTIIELVIVIAVIGVLTAVLVPTFTNLLSKANKASDDSLVSALNKALQAEEAYEGKKNDTYYDAMLDLEKNGFILPNLQTKSGEVLLWDKANNKFLYESELPTQNNNLNYWKIQNDLSEQKYSVYAGNNFAESAIEHLKVGFDAGRKNIPSIHYEGNGSAQEVVIRTNSFATTVSIKAPKDTVKHYGNAAVVNVEAIASASYHENGTVGRLSVESGHAVAEPEAIIFCFNNNGATEATPSTVEVKSGATVYNNAGEATGIEAVNTTTESFKDDCGAGHHDFGSQLVIDDRVYEVCKSCGYTLVTVVDLAGNETKTTMVDESTGEIVNTPIETYNDSATNELGQVVENKEEPIVETPAVSDHTDVTCNHNFVSTVSIEATCTQTGVKTFKCSICGASYTSNIPMKAHQYYDNIGGVHTADEKCAVCEHVRGEYVAEVNGIQYTTLTDAIAAVPANTQTLITMINDEAIYGNDGWTIAANQNIVLDLNGYTLKNLVDEDRVSQVIKNLGTLVIKDSSDLNKDGTGTGLIFNQAKADVHVGEWYGDIQYNYQTAVIINNGNFTFNSGRLLQTAVGSIEYCIDTLTNGTLYNPVVTINGGAMQNHYSNAIRMFCNSTTNENILTINGGVIRGYCAVWMQNPSSNSGRGKLTINGGTFYTEANAYLNGSKTISEVSSSIFNTDGSNHASNMYLTITGGEFFENIEWCGSTSHCTITGGTFHGYVDVYSEDATITGGTFYDAYDDPISSYVGYYKEDGNFYGGGSSNITWSLEDWENNGYTVLLASETGHKYYYLTSYPQYIGRDDGNCGGYTMASWMRSYSNTEITDLEGYYDIISPAYRHLDDLLVSEGYELIADSNNFYKVVAK